MTWSIDVEVSVGRLQIAFAHACTTGRPVALVGPNGSGKTSILRSLVGALEPRRIEFQLDDRVLASTSQAVNLPIETRGLGYVAQGGHLFAHLDVTDNVAFGLSTGPQRKDPDVRRHVASEVLTQMGLDHLAARRTTHLSGGERQQVSLARALAKEPALVLLDEPLAALDAVTRAGLRTFLAEHLQQAPALMVTHDPRDVEALGAHTLVLEGGRLVQEGSLEELSRAPATPFVRAFLAAR